jgi:hypothetical protein
MRIFEHFPELLSMIYAIFACSKSLCWAIFLLFCVTLMVGLYLLEVLMSKVEENHAIISADDLDILKLNWNGVFDGVISLIASVTGGDDWRGLALPFFHLGSSGPFYGLVYTSFILFTLLGLLNVLVGVFVSKSENFENVSLEAAIARAYSESREQVDHIEQLFNMIDANQDGLISDAEIKEGFDNRRIQAMLHHLGIDIMRPALMLKIFAGHGNTHISKAAFIRACKRLHGPAKPVEVAEILELSTDINAKLDTLMLGMAPEMHGKV